MNDVTHEEMSDKLKFIYVQLKAVDPAKQREIAVNMLEMDIDIPTIARATGMSEDEVCKLQSLG